MARYAGKKALAYLSITGTAAAASVIGLKSWSLSSATDKLDATAFGDTNKVSVQGLPDISGDISGIWDDTSDVLYDGSRSADGIKMYLYPSSDAISKYWYGPAWTDFSIETDVGGVVTISGSFAAAGNWGQM